MFIVVAGGLLLALFGLPLLAEKVPPNRLYGFRVRATLSNRTLWYAVNRFVGRRLIMVGAAVVSSGLLLYWVPAISPIEYSLGNVVVFVISMGVVLVQSFRYLKALTGSESGK